MKIFLAILFIVGVVQVFAFPTATNQRTKRDVKTQDAFEAMKNLVAEQKIIAEAVLKEFPSTAAYAQHRQQWENYLKTYNVTEKDEICLEKIIRLMEGFSDFFPKYRSPNASVEEKDILKFFEKHGINEFLENAKKTFAKSNVDNVDFALVFGEC